MPTDAAGPVLETERLELRPFSTQDVEELHDLFTGADVRRYLLDDQVVSREWVEAEVDASIERFATGSLGLWALRLSPPGGSDPSPDPDRIIGCAGFRPFFDPPELQLLYGLRPTHWGRGLATEASRAAMAHAFDRLGLREIAAATDVPNVASIRVLERLGMEEWRRTDDGPYGTIFFRVAPSAE